MVILALVKPTYEISKAVKGITVTILNFPSTSEMEFRPLFVVIVANGNGLLVVDSFTIPLT
jgi:hypothetical protein